MPTMSELLAAAVETNAPYVVRVDARAHRGATGIVWDDDGHVVTANHVVEVEDPIQVNTESGSTIAASLVGRDPGTDLALLKLATPIQGKPAWRDLDALRVGHLALTIARPGKSARASLGIVSALGDEFHTHLGGKVERYVQIDTTPQPGFSGGLAVDEAGKALGLHTTGLARRLGLVIPAVTVKRVVAELLAHGQVRRGYLGVGVYPVRLAPGMEPTPGQTTGLVLVSIEPGSPAHTAGLILGDVLVALDAQAVHRPAELSVLIDERVGRIVVAKVVRAGALADISVTPKHRE